MSVLNRIFFGTISTLALLILIPVALLSRKLRVQIGERFLGGDWRGLNLSHSIWIHAASVGELQGVTPLLNKIRAVTTDPIIITTTSVTGKSKAASLPGVYRAMLVPYDHPLLIGLAIRKIKPRLFLLFETELWPNLLLQLENFNVPSVLVNGRISDRTFPNYFRLKILVKPLLLSLHRCLVQSSKDKVRFEALGALDVKIEGNTKYETDLIDLATKGARLLKDFRTPAHVDLLVCGSVRPGESDIIYPAFRALKVKFPNLRLLIAPRHSEQFEVEAENALRFGFSVSRRTAPEIDADVLLLNSLGELKSAYSISTISFVGGTLVPVGGHNPMEPASFGKPVLIGPYTQNVEEICQELVDSKAAVRVSQTNDFVREVEKLLIDRLYLADVGKRAGKVFLCHTGSVERVFGEIRPLLNRTISDTRTSSGIIEIVLRPIEIAYQLVMNLRNFCYDSKIFAIYKSSIPVVCVGNVTVGGNAKSPVTQQIVRLLLANNLKPVVLLRGYSGSQAGPAEVLDVTAVREFGDEACMHKLQLPGVSVVVSRSRVAGAKYIESHNLGNIIVLDDGFQHRALERDLNLLLFDSRSVAQATEGRLLPVGRLRESLGAALKRADGICFIERGDEIAYPDWKPERLPGFHLALKFSGLRFLSSNREINWSEVEGKKVSLMASIAKPESFKAMIEARGVIVEKTLFKSDHAYWSHDDLPEINSLPGDFIITTAKDYIKLKNIDLLPERILIADVEVSVPQEFKDWLIKGLVSKQAF